jgi:SAM-dependent MidA family methyltransferase
MANALYGDGGFYLASGAPSRNFRTSSHASPQWATAIGRLAARVDDALGAPPDFAVVDVGAGGGELLAALADVVPARWTLVGVDVAARPPSLPTTVAWSNQAPDRISGLLIATELLDVIPVDVVEATESGPRLIDVSLAGEESLGDVVSGKDTEWLRRWWPLESVGDRAEVGWPRDEEWRSLTARVERGAAVAVDYAADPARDVAGTLTGYRDGRQVVPIPDGSCDITAHVRFDSLRAAGDELLTQREALQSLGISGSRPAYQGDPAAYLSSLSAAGEAAELIDPAGLGGFTWLVHTKRIAPILATG